MASRSYRIDANETPRLRIDTRSMLWKVFLDGQQVATMEGLSAIKRGWSATLADGRKLEVRALSPVLLPELAILVDGRHAADSPSSPRRMLRSSANGLLIGGAIFFALAFGGRRPLTRLGLTLEGMQIAGALLMLCRMYLGIALVATAVIVDLLILTSWLAVTPAPYLFFVVASRILFASFVYRAYVALRDLNAMDNRVRDARAA